MSIEEIPTLRIAGPGEPEFYAATHVFNTIAPALPGLAVTARSVSEVRTAIRYARSQRLPVRMHSTGHASATSRPVSGGLLIQTRLEQPVEIDTHRRVARIPAGTPWGPVVHAAAEHGLAAPHGSSDLVGAVGYLLRGGLSFYGRRVGLAVNSVRAVELVTAEGEWRRVDAKNDPELFWAMRGGGGGFGVVTAVEVDLFTAAEVITGGSYWPASYAEQLLSVWRRWARDAPEEATTSVRVMNLPPAPDVPPALAAGPVFCVDGVFLSTEGEPGRVHKQYSELLGSLRAVAEPILDHWALGTTADVLDAHMDPSDPMPIIGDHMLLAELGDEGVLAFLDAVGENSGSPLVAAGLRQLGGAFARRSPAGGVLDHVNAAYAYLGSGIPAGPTTRDAIRKHTAKVRAALAPWDTGLTVPSLVEHFQQPQGHLTVEQIAAVDRIRSTADPEGLFRGDIMRRSSLC